jgi:hypothetical protein
MRIVLLSVLCALVAPSLTACASEKSQYVAGTFERVEAPASAPAKGCACETEKPAAAPMRLAFKAATPVGVRYRVGPKEHVRAGLKIGPQVGKCLVSTGTNVLTDILDGLNCAIDAITPDPEPTMEYVYPEPAGTKTAAPQCAPAKAPECEPVTTAGECAGGVCSVSK